MYSEGFLATWSIEKIKHSETIYPYQISSSVLMSPSIPGDLIERIWAYVMIQTLQRKRDLTVNPTPGLQRDITDTALQYAYLNPYTRMTLGEQLGSVRGPAAMRVWDRQLPAEIRDSLSLALSPFPTSTPPEKPVGNGGGDDSTGVGMCGAGNSLYVLCSLHVAY